MQGAYPKQQRSADDPADGYMTAQSSLATLATADSGWAALASAPSDRSAAGGDYPLRGDSMGLQPRMSMPGNDDWVRSAPTFATLQLRLLCPVLGSFVKLRWQIVKPDQGSDARSCSAVAVATLVSIIREYFRSIVLIGVRTQVDSKFCRVLYGRLAAVPPHWRVQASLTGSR